MDVLNAADLGPQVPEDKGQGQYSGYDMKTGCAYGYPTI